MVVSRLLLSIFFYNYCFILAVSSEPNRSNLSRLSPGLSTVEGPGVDGKRQPLPMEYFYVQLMNEGGEKFKGAIDESLLTIDFISSPESRVFVNKKIHYLREGLFAVRYRLHREVASLSISVKYNNQHIGDSPYTIGKALVDKCFCPERTVKQWLKDFKCPSSYRQVDDSLALYKSKGIKLSQLPVRLANEFSNTHGIHYSIVNNKLYGKTFGTITDFRAMSDMILTSMLNKAQLPDMEFIVQVSDWPQDKNDPKKEPFPFFSCCGSEYYRDIVWPQYDLMRHTVQAMDRVELDMMWLQQGLSLPWSERIPKAFFRGRDSNKVRLDFVSKYRKKTDLFNVTLD
ncbi:PREDICTED: KDEL motif-containing protein 1-like, partial [Amphimedon queenslandica]|uniref:Glycosyl transferase CAP10 domain-containing protein n=1 Tax=Amphimedon queenslandica TaxID=400682 RepID=A0AAN0JCU6_AMPQE